MVSAVPVACQRCINHRMQEKLWGDTVSAGQLWLHGFLLSRPEPEALPSVGFSNVNENCGNPATTAIHSHILATVDLWLQFVFGKLELEKNALKSFFFSFQLQLFMDFGFVFVFSSLCFWWRQLIWCKQLIVLRKTQVLFVFFTRLLSLHLTGINKSKDKKNTKAAEAKGRWLPQTLNYRFTASVSKHIVSRMWL